MHKFIIGVDIGGTKISSGLFNSENKLLTSNTLPTLAEKPKDIIINQIVKSIQTVLESKQLKPENLKGIGICSPGPINPITGDILNPPNLPSLWNTNLLKELATFFPVKTVIENDANAAALAEHKFGAAKGYNNVFYITVSTGIGTGIIINNKIYHGKNGFAGEGGHLSLDLNGKINCNCKIPACIESQASGTAIAKKAISLIKNNQASNSRLNSFQNNLESLTAKEIGILAKENDTQALQIIHDSALKVGAWLGGMINLLDPDIIIIGGGVASLGDLYINKVKETTLKFTYNPYASHTPIVAALLKKNVGIYGAASLFID